MFQTEPDILRLDMVMKSIVKKLQQLSPDRFYVIDFMPNLKWLLGNNYFIKECNTEFRSFESKVGANVLEKDLEECVFFTPWWE